MIALNKVETRRITADELELGLIARKAAFGKLTDQLTDRHDDDPNTRHFVTLYRGDPVATGRLIVGCDLPSAAILLARGFITPDDLTNTTAEPSRVGMSDQVRGNRLRRGIFRSIVGAIVLDAFTHGNLVWHMTVTPELYRNLSEFPYRLGAHFSSELHGPNSELKAMFPAGLYVPEIMAASRYLQPDLCDLMFPQGVPSLDGLPVRPNGELAATVSRNATFVGDELTRWNDYLTSHPLAQSPVAC